MQVEGLNAQGNFLNRYESTAMTTFQPVMYPLTYEHATVKNDHDCEKVISRNRGTARFNLSQGCCTRNTSLVRNFYDNYVRSYERVMISQGHCVHVVRSSDRVRCFKRGAKGMFKILITYITLVTFHVSI